MTAYDVLPYPGQPFPQAHPRRLAMMAYLHGQPAPSVSSCRVLELGCGDGGHLLPMAAELPQSVFTGVDLSSQAIEKGRRLASSASLANVNFHVAAVENFRPEGQFDFIIAHGLYSWVPDEARSAVLRLCGECLSSNGVAYVSYNVHPGQKVREIARDFMQMHSSENIPTALDGLKMAAAARIDTSFYTLGLLAEWKRLDAANLHLVAHDTFAEWHHPVYFREFASEASRHGLHFISEAQLASSQDSSLQPDARDFLNGVVDPLAREQYRDFFRGTSYRESLLARNTGPLQRQLFSDLWVGCGLHVAGDYFTSDNGAKIIVDHPYAREALRHLCAAWPSRLRFTDIAETEDERDVLTEMVIRMTRPGVLDCDLAAWPFASRLSAKPMATSLARAQAAENLASLRHIPLRLDNQEACRVLALLDGSQDLAALACSEDVLKRLLHLSLLVS